MFGGSQLIEPVYMVVLTGGPCSGKSSSLAYLTEKLTDSGFMVFVIPETATLITGNGIDRRKMDRPRQVLVYEEAILDMQLSFEETYREAVTRIFPEKKKVLLLDRGVIDIKAFMPHEEFYAILKRKGLQGSAASRPLPRGRPSRHGGGRGQEALHRREQSGQDRDPGRGHRYRPQDTRELARPSPVQAHR